MKKSIFLIFCIISAINLHAAQAKKILNDEEEADFLRAVSGKNSRYIEKLLPKIDLNFYHNFALRGHDSPLTLAIALEYNDLVDLFIKNGANVNLADENKDTPLMQAAFVNNYDAVLKLLENGANPNAKSDMGHTALKQALRKPEDITVAKQIIKALLFYAANINSNEFQQFLLHELGNSKIFDEAKTEFINFIRAKMNQKKQLIKDLIIDHLLPPLAEIVQGYDPEVFEKYTDNQILKNIDELKLKLNLNIREINPPLLQKPPKPCVIL